VCEASTRVGSDSARSYGHLNPRQAGEVARAAGARSLLLTHYTGLDAESAMLEDARRSGYGGGLALAFDGQRVEL
jgi:ribonuclease BN (tRNA processing enzyme)